MTWNDQKWLTVIKKVKFDGRTAQRTEGPTDGWMDKADFRAACTQLKTGIFDKVETLKGNIKHYSMCLVADWKMVSVVYRNDIKKGRCQKPFNLSLISSETFFVEEQERHLQWDELSIRLWFYSRSTQWR